VTSGVSMRRSCPGGSRHRRRAPAIRRERREGKPLAETERGMRECMAMTIVAGKVLWGVPRVVCYGNRRGWCLLCRTGKKGGRRGVREARCTGEEEGKGRGRGMARSRHAKENGAWPDWWAASGRHDLGVVATVCLDRGEYGHGPHLENMGRPGRRKMSRGQRNSDIFYLFE
jgi:hypothetical protein